MGWPSWLLLGPLFSVLAAVTSGGKISKVKHDPVPDSKEYEEKPDSLCSGAKTIEKDVCLSKADAKCMWIETESDGNLCLPCQEGEIDQPCPTIGSFFAMKKVKDCRMSCAHQSVIKPTGAECLDTSGSITMAQCHAKGASVLGKCMWTQYTLNKGRSRDFSEQKTMCGPCTVVGVGTVPCSAPGNIGPEPDSTVDGCVSQCELLSDEFGIPCDPVLGLPAQTMCRPTPLPIPLVLPVKLKDMGIKMAANAPDYQAVPVPPPYDAKAYTEAARVAGWAGLWPSDTKLPPTAGIMVSGPPPFEGPAVPPEMQTLVGPPPPGIEGSVVGGAAIAPGWYIPAGVPADPPKGKGKGSFLQKMKARRIASVKKRNHDRLP